MSQRVEIHSSSLLFNGTDLECDGNELRPDGTCAKCERVNERIKRRVAGLVPLADQVAEDPQNMANSQEQTSEKQSVAMVARDLVDSLFMSKQGIKADRLALIKEHRQGGVSWEEFERGYTRAELERILMDVLTLERKRGAELQREVDAKIAESLSPDWRDTKTSASIAAAIRSNKQQ